MEPPDENEGDQDDLEVDQEDDFEDDAEAGAPLVEYADDDNDDADGPPAAAEGATELTNNEEEIRQLLLGGLQQDTKILKELGVEAVHDDEPEEGQLPQAQSYAAIPRTEGEVVSGLKVLGKCTVCNEKQAKYRCPRCFAQSCSLDCSKKHKEDASCSGERNKTQFTPLSKFTDSTLRSDYNFLQEITKDVKSKPPARGPPMLPAYLKNLVYQAKKREIRLKLMPLGMSKRKRNKSQYDYKKHIIFWRVEWRLAARPDLVLSSDRMDETLPLNQGLENVLKAHNSSVPADTELTKPYLDALRTNSAAFMFRIEPVTGSQASYLEVNSSDSLLQCLQRKQVVEFPTFLVALPPEKAVVHIAAASDPAEELKLFPPTPASRTTGGHRGRGVRGRGRGRGRGRNRGGNSTYTRESSASRIP